MTYSLHACFTYGRKFYVTGPRRKGRFAVIKVAIHCGSSTNGEESYSATLCGAYVEEFNKGNKGIEFLGEDQIDFGPIYEYFADDVEDAKERFRLMLAVAA